MARFIHTSDWQLGMTRAFLSEEAGARFSQERIDAISRLGELANERRAAFIVVAGDVFESNQVSRQTLLRTLDALRLLPVPIFLLPGNHDPLNSASVFASREFRNAGDHIIVLRDRVPVPVPASPGMEVVGAPWRTKRPATDLCAELASSLKPAEGIVRIAVAHGQVDVLWQEASRRDVIALAGIEQALRERKFHYVALGDRHSVTRVGDTGRVWYSGAPVATAFDETEPNRALLVEVEADGDCRVEPLRVGNWSFVAADFPLNGPPDVERFRDWLAGLPNKHCTAITAGFRGSINLATAAQLDDLMAAQAEVFASLRRSDRTSDLAIVPDEFDQDSVALSGYARAAWDELLGLAQHGDTAAQDALRLFYRVSAQGAE